MPNFRDAAQATSAKPTTPTLLNIHGAVKWFDPSKGHGFIVPHRRQEFDRDILFHRAILAAAGYKRVAPGQQVLCDAVVTSTGAVAKKIKLLHPILDSSPSRKEDICDDVPVKVKAFNPIRGYGFLVADTVDPRINTRLEIFVHAETLAKARITNIQPGDSLRADVWLKAPKGTGLRALTVRPSGAVVSPMRPTSLNGAPVTYAAPAPATHLSNGSGN